MQRFRFIIFHIKLKLLSETPELLRKKNSIYPFKLVEFQIQMDSLV